MLTLEQKKEIVKTYGKTEHDTGSTAVQIALLTARIKDLADHCARHKTEAGNYKDKHSYRGLEKLINQRKSFQKYLKRKDGVAYKDLIGKLGLRK
jgi:small subunit ribosomal protein S15